MPQDIFYVIFNTAIGWVGVLGSTKGLVHITLPQKSKQDSINILGSKLEQAELSYNHFKDITVRLKAYFSGREVEFRDKLDLSGATRFQNEVWQAVKCIPYGETRSYSWVARQINRPNASRAVGQAVGRNPLPIVIPCHRVVANGGGIGGFGGGLDMKRYLLRLEAESRKERLILL